MLQEFLLHFARRAGAIEIADPTRRDLVQARLVKTRLDKSCLDEIDAKVAAYPNERKNSLGRRVFTRDPAPPEVVRASRAKWHSLSDLYGPAPRSKPGKKRA
jgi:hypothetical protein